jgi:hypothetical protein
MVSEQRHEMKLTVTHPSGAEEWMCPECGRRFVAEWEPKFRRVFIERGQDDVVHVGNGMGSLHLNVDRPDEDPGNGTRLQDVWKKYLDKLDFDSEDDNNPAKSPT